MEFSYFITERKPEGIWSWVVVDEIGETVARGEASTESVALEAGRAATRSLSIVASLRRARDRYGNRFGLSD